MRCAHQGAVPVESVVTGEVLAALCPDCDQQLPAEFLARPHDGDAAMVASLVAMGWEPASAHRAVTERDMRELKHRFLEAQAEPYRTLYLPTIASLSAPTPGEIEGGP